MVHEQLRLQLQPPSTHNEVNERSSISSAAEATNEREQCHPGHTLAVSGVVRHDGTMTLASQPLEARAF